jgi:hypothetical protein
VKTEPGVKVKTEPTDVKPNLSLPVNQPATGPKVTKGWKVDYESKAPPRKNTTLASATETFGTMASYFSPTAAQERDSNRAINQIQLQHIAHLETQLQQARSSYEHLQDKHREEQMALQQCLMEFQARALQAEAETRMLKHFSDAGRRRPCEYDPEDEERAPRRRRYETSSSPAPPPLSSSPLLPSLAAIPDAPAALVSPAKND